MKKIFVLLVSLIVLLNGYYLSYASDEDDKQQIIKLLRAVYKEKTKEFAKIETKKSKQAIIAYYKKFFTDDTSIKLTNTVERSKKGDNGGAFYKDPRYGDMFSKEDGVWYPNDEDRNVKKIVFLAPMISGNKAVAKVDYLIAPGADDDVMRSEYHLIKTSNGWKIDNIFWGPQENFEHGVTQSILQLK